MAVYHYTFANGKGVWFTSDIHLHHANIIKYCKRPFTDTDEMDEAIIANWNSVVGKNDTVFILGDVGFGSPDTFFSKIKRLNGKKILIIGNHDRGYLGSQEFLSLFEAVHEQVYIKVGKNKIYLTHFPLLCFDGAYSGITATWNLYGHCHSFPGSGGLDMQRLIHCFPTQYDVGVDNNNYTPISFDAVKEKIHDQQMSLNMSRDTFTDDTSIVDKLKQFFKRVWK